MVRTIQLSAFAPSPTTADILPLLTTHFPGAAIQNLDLSSPQKRATAVTDGLSLQLLAMPGRLDLVIFRDTGMSEPLNGEIDPAGMLTKFRSPFLELASAVSAARLSLVLVSGDQVEDRQKAVEAIAAKLHITKLPSAINELEARANAPVAIDGINYNRNVTLSVAEVSFVLAAGAVMHTQRRTTVLNHQVDVNSATEHLLTETNRPIVFDTLRDMALSLVGGGWEALDG